MSWLLVLVGLARGECVPVPAETLREQVIRAQKELGVRTAGAFKDQAAAIREELPCVTGVLTPDDAVQLHSLEWLSAWFEQRSGDSARAFQAVRRLDPAWRPPVPIAEEGTEIYDRAAAIGAATPSRLVLPLPDGSAARVDGKRATDHPVETPYLLQYLGPTGEVLLTAYLHGDDPIPVPSTAVAPAPAPAVRPSPEPTPAPTPPDPVVVAEPAPGELPESTPGLPDPAVTSFSSVKVERLRERLEARDARGADGRPSRNLVWLGTTAAVLGATTGLIGLAPRGELWQRSCDRLPENEAIDAGCRGLAGSANALMTTGITLGVGALGLGVTAFVVGNW